MIARDTNVLALSAKIDGFVTFDRALAKQAVKSGALPPVAIA